MTETENPGHPATPGGLLGELRESTFLGQWGCPTAVREDGSAFCDLAVVVSSGVFLFFEIGGPPVRGKDRESRRDALGRWMENTLAPALEALRDAARHLLDGGRIFSKGANEESFGFEDLSEECPVYRFVMVNGGISAEDAGTHFTVSYGDPARGDDESLVRLDRNDPAHVIDSRGAEIFRHLDTVADFVMYVEKKEEAAAKLELLRYRAERDLLAVCMENEALADAAEDGRLDARAGLWEEFCGSPRHLEIEETREAGRLWNDLERKSRRKSTERDPKSEALIPDRVGDPTGHIAAVSHEHRARLSEHVAGLLEELPGDAWMKFESFCLTGLPETRYVLLQTRLFEYDRPGEDYEVFRRRILESVCGATKNRFPEVEFAVGMAMEASDSAADVEDDFILLDCLEWSEDDGFFYARQSRRMRLDFDGGSRPPERAGLAERIAENLFPPTRGEALDFLEARAREGTRLLDEKGFDPVGKRKRWARVVGEYLEKVFGPSDDPSALLPMGRGAQVGFAKLTEEYDFAALLAEPGSAAGSETDRLLRDQIEFVELTMQMLSGAKPARVKSKSGKPGAKKPGPKRPKKKKSRRKR